MNFEHRTFFSRPSTGITFDGFRHAGTCVEVGFYSLPNSIYAMFIRGKLSDGEALMTDIGLTGGGQGHHQIYLGGEKAHRLNEGDEGGYIRQG